MNMLPGSHDNQMVLYISINALLCEKVTPLCPLGLWNAAKSIVSQVGTCTPSKWGHGFFMVFFKYRLKM